MVGKDFEVGDLVWAKMKGFPYWPARIENPSAGAKSPSVKKAQHYVFFFGSKNFAWILDELIVPHSEEMISSCSNKKKSATFQGAIDEIVQLSKRTPKKSPTVVKEKIEENNENFKPSPSIVNNNSAEKKVKVQKKTTPKVIFPKKVVKVQKKRRYSLDAAEVNHQHSPPAKSRRIGEDYSALLSNVPPTMGTSRVAVIRPYDEEAVVHQSTGILQRAEYVERPKTPVLDIRKISPTLQSKNITATSKKIGFLGLGIMGRGIVKNLLNSGHNVTIWNRTPERCKPFVECDAIQCLTPADVVHSCDITFCCVSDPEAAKALVFGNCGVLKGFEGCNVGSKGYVEMTSIDPTTSLEIAEAIQHVGGRYLEAPVSGSRLLAEDGSLLILGAGDRELFNDCETCFFAISKNAYYLSCIIGSGSKMNLILSMFLGTTYAALAEAMALVERCKLSQGNFLEILDLGPLSCANLLEKGHAMIERNFTINASLKHQQKDLNLALALGNSVEQPMLIAAAANELFKHAKLLRYADHDVSAIVYGAKY